MRALATVCMLVGVDDERGPQLYKVDPAGHFFPFKVGGLRGGREGEGEGERASETQAERSS